MNPEQRFNQGQFEPAEELPEKIVKVEEEEIDPDEVFKRVEREIKEKEELGELKNIMSEWLEQQKSRIRERLGHFGVDEEKVEELIKQISGDFLNDLRFASEEFAAIKACLPEIKNKLKKTEEIEAAYSWLEVASNLALYKLFKRKFSGETNNQDENILILMNIIKHRGLGGQMTSLDEAISLSLFNEKSLSGYEKVLDHELTHYGLNSFASQANAIELRGRKELKENIGQVSPAYAFSGFLTAINESAAHLVEGRQPEFSGYADKVSPQIFERVYQKIKKAVEDINLEEKDKYFADVYGRMAAKWHDDITIEEVSQIIAIFE